MMIRRLLLASLIGGTTSFVIPSSSRAQVLSRKLTQVNNDKGTGWDSFRDLREIFGISFANIPAGEEQRKFRRTLYAPTDWTKHRSQDRFICYLITIFNSGVYKNTGREVSVITLVAIYICLYNGLVGGFVGLDGVQQAALIQGEFFCKLALPMSVFSLTSPSLGLLLVFRTNSSYQRWDEARKNWGMNINRARDLLRMANCYYDSTDVSPEQREDDLKHVALCTWSFMRAMKRHLSPDEEDEADFRIEVFDKLPGKQAEMIVAAAHRPNRALQDLSFAIDDLPMHFTRKNEIHGAVTMFEDNLGSSERLLTSPVPLFNSRHLSRFLAVWLLFLPFGLYNLFPSWNHVAMIPATAVISVFLLGIEELGTQLEEPFTILPMQAFCDKIYNWCMEIASWQPGDNGRPMNRVLPRHNRFTSGVVAPRANGDLFQYAPDSDPTDSFARSHVSRDILLKSSEELRR